MSSVAKTVAYLRAGASSGAIAVSKTVMYLRVSQPVAVAVSKTVMYLRVGIENCMIGEDANPACIIYECLTNSQWGMGSPVTGIDGASFQAAKSTLRLEAFGMSMMWTQQSKIEDFIQEVLDHIQAVLYVDPATGLLTIKLIRGDYDPATLPILTPSNADLSSFQRKLWGDIVNEIVVTWTNPDNEQEETVTAHDLASIAIQGGVVSDSRNYYGVRNASLAQRLAWRDLRSAGQPLASCEASVDRSFWELRPASVVKVTWPEYSLTDIVMRVLSVDYGTPGEPEIKLSLIEDVYGLDIGVYSEPPSSLWEDPSASPPEIETFAIFTAPYFSALASDVAGFVDTPAYAEVVSAVLATTSEPDAYEYELWDEITLPNGSLDWQRISVNTVLGMGLLDAALPAAATSSAVSFGGIIGNTLPVIGGFVVIGDGSEAGSEIAMVEAIGATYDLTRGVLDTVPRDWPASTPCWFLDESTIYEDPILRSAGETADYKLLARTSQGLYSLASATLESYLLTDRPWLPNRPANCVAYGESFSSRTAPIDAIDRADAWITCSWAVRNRLLEDAQVLSWTDASQTAESGQTTTIEVRDPDGSLLTTHDGLTGTTFDVPDASFLGEALVELRFLSERSDGDGDFVSLQYFSHWIQLAEGVRRTEPGEARTTESGIVRMTED